MKKVLISLLILLHTGIVFGETTITMWSRWSSDPHLSNAQRLFEAFEKENPGIKVKHVSYDGNQYLNLLPNVLTSRNPPDILTMNGGGDAFKYIEPGLIEPVNDVYDAIKENVIPGLEATLVYEGKAYGVPFSNYVGNIIWFNKEMLKTEGIDPNIQTWDQFLSALEHFKKQGKAPISFGAKEGWTGNHWVNHIMHRNLKLEEYISVSLRTLDKSVKTKVTWEDPRISDAWNAYRELYEKGYFTSAAISEDFNTARDAFLQGKTPFFQTGSWVIADIYDRAYNKDHFDFIIFPKINGGTEQNEVVISSQVISIPKNSSNKEAAKKLMAFFSSETANRIWAEGGNTVPYQFDTTHWKIDNHILQKMVKTLSKASTATPFLDILEDANCNREWFWEPSIGILTGAISAERIGQGHERCNVRVISRKKWNKTGSVIQ